MDLTLLQKFLDNNSIPKIKEKQKTFLGIAKQPHYENVLSNIYAFFFDVNEEHGMNDLFLRSFQELIYMTELGEKKNIELHNNFTIETERGTKGGGRIDLLLSSDHHAIIIENKVTISLKLNFIFILWLRKTITYCPYQRINEIGNKFSFPNSKFSRYFHSRH